MSTQHSKDDRHNLPIDEMLDVYEKKTKYHVQRRIMAENVYKLAEYGHMTYEQTLRALEIFTVGLSKDDEKSYGRDGYHVSFAERTGQILSLLPKMNKDEPLEPGTNIIYKEYEELDNTAPYWKNVEILVNKLDTTLPAEKRINKLKNFSECLRDIADSSHENMRSYNGTTLKISGKTHKHLHSVLILPDKPENAIATLHLEKARMLFAEHERDESAEAVVLDLYGTDGAYANHYWELLDCQTRYPDQKHLHR